MAIMYLSIEKFTCLKKQITISLIYLTVLKQYINYMYLENSMKQDINSDQDPQFSIQHVS